MPAPPRPDGSRGRLLADVMSFGWVLPAAIAAGAGLGWLLDRLLGSFPVATAVLGLLGLAAGLRSILREADALARDAGHEGDGEEDGKGDGGDGKGEA